MIIAAKDPSGKFIFSLVLLLHAAFLLWLSFLSPWKPLAAPHRKKIVAVFAQAKPPEISVIEEKKPIAEESTAHAEPESKSPSFAESPTRREESKPRAEPEPPPVIEQKPAPSIKDAPKAPATHVIFTKPAVKKTQAAEPPKEKPKQKSPVSKPKKTEASKPAKKPAETAQLYDAMRKKQLKLLSQAKERIGKIQKAPFTKDAASTIAPAKIEALQIDQLSIDTPQEISYKDELSQRLKSLMKLPEYGEVRLKLTLNRSGKVMKVKILQSDSASNQKHVEEALPSLKMPPFGKNFENQAEYTFTITMSNIPL
jgi:colicin import membrane protein